MKKFKIICLIEAVIILGLCICIGIFAERFNTPDIYINELLFSEDSNNESDSPFILKAKITEVKEDEFSISKLELYYNGKSKYKLTDTKSSFYDPNNMDKYIEKYEITGFCEYKIIKTTNLIYHKTAMVDYDATYKVLISDIPYNVGDTVYLSYYNGAVDNKLSNTTFLFNVSLNDYILL